MNATAVGALPLSYCQFPDRRDSDPHHLVISEKTVAIDPSQKNERANLYSRHWKQIGVKAEAEKTTVPARSVNFKK